MDKDKIEKELTEKKIHVVYYTPGVNMRGLNNLMMNLTRLWGKRVVALPKDVTKLSQNDKSLEELIWIRNMLNSIIIPKQRELGLIPPAPPPQQNKPSVGPRPDMPYQPQNGPSRPPAPPTSGSNAVKPNQQSPNPPTSRQMKKGFIRSDEFTPPPFNKNK